MILSGASACQDASDIIKDPDFKAKAIETIADKIGVAVSQVKNDLTSACSRRLGTQRELQSTATITNDYTVDVPAGQNAATLANNIATTQASDFTSALKNNLATTKFANLSVEVKNIVKPATTVGLTGYTCKKGEACWFGKYLTDTHFTINDNTAVTLAQCGQRCNADASCQAFEHDAQSTKSTCAFWKAGACNIPGGNPPGYVKDIAVLADVNTCERDSVTKATRGAFTPVTSKSGRRSIVGVLLALMWAFLMSAMTV
jgi:hypothetical protein